MKKRIICLAMALVMAWTCVSALAAQYDGLPEKMMLQMELSGLKGSVTLSATGNPELEALLSGLFRDTTLEIRGIRSSGQAQYQAYFQRGETQLGLTQFFGDEESFVLSSALAPEEKLRFSATESLLQQLLPQEEGLNPQWYTAALKILQVDAEDWTANWETALAPYEQALEMWLNGYAAAPTVIRQEDGETRMQVNYEIPASAAKTEAAALVRSMLMDESLRSLLAGVMSESQAEAYLNTEWADYYAQRIGEMDLTGTISLERQMALTGDVLYTKILLPVPAEETGYDTLMIYQEGDALTVTLAGSVDTLIFSITDKEEGVSGVRMQGVVERQMLDGSEGGFKTEYSLLRTTRESIDDDGRQHQYESLTLTLTPEEGEAAELTALAHFHSLSANRNPTTLELDASWKQGEMTLTLQGEFKTTSPWVLQVIDETGAEDVANLSKQELEDIMADYAAGALALIQQMSESAPQAAATEETAETLAPESDATSTPAAETEATAEPSPETEAATQPDSNAETTSEPTADAEHTAETSPDMENTATPSPETEATVEPEDGIAADVDQDE